MRRLHRLARVEEPGIGQYLQGTDVANIKQGLPLPISVPFAHEPRQLNETGALERLHWLCPGQNLRPAQV